MMYSRNPRTPSPGTGHKKKNIEPMDLICENVHNVTLDVKGNIRFTSTVASHCNK